MTHLCPDEIAAEVGQLRLRVAELERENERLRFRRLVEELPAGALLVEDGALYLNRVVEAITGYPRAALPTLDAWFKTLYGPRAAAVRALYEADRAKGFPAPRTAALVRRDGEERIIEFIGWREGLTELWLLRDATDSARVARLLEQTARAAQVGGWELECRTGRVFWTAETYRLHELSPSMYTPTLATSLAYYAPESVPQIRAAVQRAIDEGEPYDLELVLITETGKRIQVRALGDVECEEGKTVKVFGSLQDITRQRQADEALRRSEEQKRRLIASSPDCLVELDLEGRLLFINPLGVELLELDEESSALGKSWLEFWPEESRPDVLAALELARQGQEARFQAGGATCKGTAKWWDVQITAIRDQNGAVERLLADARDSTPLKHAELERQEFERNLQQTQKLESLGVLAGGIAHDFNNLLTGILGHADLVRFALMEGKPAFEYLGQIERSAERAADLCRQMLAYAGKGRLVVEPSNLSAVVGDTYQLLQLSVSKKAALTLCLSPGLPAILADVTQLRQVLMNLVINASEALGDQEGIIAISTGRQVVDRDYLQEAHPASAQVEGPYVYLEVSDSGGGMDAETLARIFEPFYTTKFTGRGLGLSAVLGIVRGHNGILHVESSPGQGCRFRLLFPATSQAAVEVPAPLRPRSSWHGHGTVLVVDDEEPVRRVAAALVASLSFVVIEAEDGRDALKKLKQHEGQVRLVLLDLTMPRLDGEQTLAELQRIASKVPVVLMSGYSERELSERFAGKGLAAFLQKPFTREDMRTRLRQALGE
jgi:PAS domain S-box-containing protein